MDARILAFFIFCLVCIPANSEDLNPAPLRRLLQVKKECPFDFSTVDYTPVTKVCKDPYPPGPCCSAFVNLTCKYLQYINDNTTNCADQEFAYLNTAGNYPGGLFANLCVEGPEGLACPMAPAPDSSLVPAPDSYLAPAPDSYLAAAPDSSLAPAPDSSSALQISVTGFYFFNLVWLAYLLLTALCSCS